MRFFVLILVVLSLSVVWAKSSSNKALTESLGQEVIELTGPVKELDEEPAAESEDDDPTTTTFQPATRNRKVPLETRRRQKDEKETTKLDDEEARIAKELAEIYKDNSDYKDDKSEESTSDATTRSTRPASTQEPPAKLAERQRPSGSFKFQPNDINNKKEVERFRTSVDDISCDRSKTKLTDEQVTKAAKKSAYSVWANVCLVLLGELFVLSC